MTKTGNPQKFKHLNLPNITLNSAMNLNLNYDKVRPIRHASLSYSYTGCLPITNDFQNKKS